LENRSVRKLVKYDLSNLNDITILAESAVREKGLLRATAT